LAKFYSLFLRHTLFQDWRAKDQFWKHFGPQMKTVIGDAGNAFPLPDIVDSEILAFAREVSVVLQYARIWQMTSDKQSFPAETAAAQVSWGNTTQESEPGITEVELDANELSAYSVVKNATLMDARSDIVSWLTVALAEAAGQELDNQGFNGSGSPFIGILNPAGAGFSVTLGGSSFSNVSFEDFSVMIAKLDGLRKQGARFWMHGQGLHLVRTLKDDNNRPIFYDTVGSPTSGTILGYPYSEVIKMPSIDAANTAFMAFGNLRYLCVGRRLEVSTLSADPYGLWTTNRMRYKLYQRWGMKIGLREGFVRMLTSS
jgi:HK97 family phage major capsid protein